MSPLPVELMSKELPGMKKQSMPLQPSTLMGVCGSHACSVEGKGRSLARPLVNVFLLCFSPGIHVPRQGVGVKGMCSRMKRGSEFSFTGRLVLLPWMLLAAFNMDGYQLEFSLGKTSQSLPNVSSFYPKQQFHILHRTSCFQLIGPFLVVETVLASPLAHLPTCTVFLNKWMNSDSTMVCQMEWEGSNFIIQKSHPTRPQLPTLIYCDPRDTIWNVLVPMVKRSKKKQLT